MRNVLAVPVVIAVAVLAPTGSAQAAQTCKTETVHVKAHHRVKVKQIDAHGHAIKKHGKVVYKTKRVHGKIVIVTKLVAYTKTERKKVCTIAKTTAPVLTTGAVAVVPHVSAQLDPAFTQDANDPAVVTWTVSAANGGNPLPSGVLQFFVEGQLVDTLNVGGNTMGGTMTARVPRFGAIVTNLTYVSADGSLTTTTGNETETVLPPGPSLHSLPANIDLPATSANGRSITYTAPSATDWTGTPLPVSCHPGSGILPIGVTSVSCSTTDNSVVGYPQTTTGSFTVKIDAPTSAPTIHGTPADITVPPDTAQGATITYAPPTATDAFGSPANVSCSIPSGTFQGIGTQANTCTATDTYGNTATSTFNVTVQPVTVSFHVAYDTSPTSDSCVSNCNLSGTDVPATLSLPLTWDGSENYAGILLEPTITGSLASDPNPAGQITLTVNPNPWMVTANGQDCHIMQSGDGCNVYFLASTTYTIGLLWESADPNYPDQLITSEVTITAPGT